MLSSEHRYHKHHSCYQPPPKPSLYMHFVFLFLHCPSLSLMSLTRYHRQNHHSLSTLFFVCKSWAPSLTFSYVAYQKPQPAIGTRVFRSGTRVLWRRLNIGQSRFEDFAIANLMLIHPSLSSPFVADLERRCRQWDLQQQSPHRPSFSSSVSSRSDERPTILSTEF